MKLTGMFWNLNRKALPDRVARLAREHQVDLLILTELSSPLEELRAVLTSSAGIEYHVPFSPAREIGIFSRLPEGSIRPVYDDPLGHITIRRIIVEDRADFLLAAVHLQSKRHWRDDDQIFAATRLAEAISDEEARYGHHRTILVGDMNMNPFEPGMVAAGGLHSVMTKQIARAENRTVNGRRHPFFYNPMWGHFGDRTAGPAGTYYYRGSQPVTFFWNMFDQVLLRPALMDSLVDLRILDAEGETSLLFGPSGRPDTRMGSDHLPLLFTLDL